MKALFRKEIVAWALYDWANSAYATVAVAVFFPLIFSNYWFAGSASENTTTPLGIANSVTSLLIVLLAPVLGAIADRGGMKKRFLLVFTIIGLVFVSSLVFIEQGDWILALSVYALAGVGFSGANIFYDALLLDISPRSKLDIVSALGFALGYLGGGLALLIAIVLTSFPQLFGFSSAQQAMLASFIVVALWWGLFSIPLLLAVRESRIHREVSFGQSYGCFCWPTGFTSTGFTRLYEWRWITGCGSTSIR
jgi:UMF1 family MFS transporter